VLPWQSLSTVPKSLLTKPVSGFRRTVDGVLLLGSRKTRRIGWLMLGATSFDLYRPLA